MDHVEQLIDCFSCIRRSSLKINAKKCSFKLKEIPYLGYVITREGVKQDPKNIQGIMDLKWPKTTTDQRNIVSMVQYYRNIRKRFSHVLTPIMEASVGKNGKQTKWTKYIEQNFLYLKKIVWEETLLNYPDRKIHLTIHTDASDKQLSAFISHNNKPIAFLVKDFQKQNWIIKQHRRKFYRLSNFSNSSE